MFPLKIAYGNDKGGLGEGVALLRLTP